MQEIKPGIQVVIACYTGPRRRLETEYQEDCTIHLMKHAAALDEQVDSFVVVLNENRSSPPTNRDAIFLEAFDNLDIPNKKLIRRPNSGMSYGAWADALSREVYDYNILFEDDYIPVVKNYPTVFRSLSDKSGFLYICQIHTPATPSVPEHAGLASGIVRGSAVQKVASTNLGLLPAGRKVGDDYISAEAEGNIGQSHAFVKSGIALAGFIEFGYHTYYQGINGVFHLHGREECPPCILPSQMVPLWKPSSTPSVTTSSEPPGEKRSPTDSA